MRNTTGYKRIAAAFYGQPLALLPSKLADIRAFLEGKFQGRSPAPDRVREIRAQRRPGGTGVQYAGRVGVIPILGLLSQRGSCIDDMSEPTVSCEQVGAALDQLVADKSCKSIVMLFDTPGGSVNGIAELANKIYSLRSEKKIVGMVDSCCASAGYWLASQCSSLSITTGGQCGSIGVLVVHEDHSGEAEQAGVQTTLVTSSKYKSEGHPFGPLDAEAKAELQSKCDSYHALFVAAIARGRGTTEGVVNKTYGQGRMLTATQARTAGMVDKVQTFSQLLKDMGSGGEGMSGGGDGYGATTATRPAVSSSGRLGWREAKVRAAAVEAELGAEEDRDYGGAPPRHASGAVGRDNDARRGGPTRPRSGA